MERTRFFHYRTGNTFLHRTPAWLKVLLIPILAIVAFQLPTRIALIAWACALLFSLFLRCTPKEIASDARPTLVYFVFLYSTSLVFNISAWNETASERVITGEALRTLFRFAPEYALLFCRMGLSLAITALIYRTTSNMQFRQGFAAIESFVTRKDEAHLADLLGMTLTFIPRITAYWERISTAWQARGGKNSIGKIIRLTPRLFSVSMHDAYEKARAIENRKA